MAKMIQVKDLKLIRVHVDQSPFGLSKADTSASQEIDFDLLGPADRTIEHRYIMLLRIKGGAASKKNMPLAPTYEIHAVAEFETPEGLTPSDEKGLVVLNGGMILYGMIRGQVSLITGAFPGGTVLLPAIDWRSKVQEIQEKQGGGEKEPGVPSKSAPAKPAKRQSRGAKRASSQEAGGPKAQPNLHQRRRSKKT